MVEPSDLGGLWHFVVDYLIESASAPLPHIRPAGDSMLGRNRRSRLACVGASAASAGNSGEQVPRLRLGYLHDRRAGLRGCVLLAVKSHEGIKWLDRNIARRQHRSLIRAAATTATRTNSTPRTDISCPTESKCAKNAPPTIASTKYSLGLRHCYDGTFGFAILLLI